jgi:hypothetical protein
MGTCEEAWPAEEGGRDSEGNDTKGHVSRLQLFSDHVYRYVLSSWIHRKSKTKPCTAMLVQEHVWSQTARQPPPEGWREPSPGYYEREEEEDAPEEFNPANLRAHRIFHRSVGNYEPPRRDQFWTEEDEVAEAAAAASRAQEETEAASGSEYEPDD